MTTIPKARPKLDGAIVRRAALSMMMRDKGIANVAELLGRCPVQFFAVRGYYDTNGVGVYDDAIFLLLPDEVRAFNGNVDPSRLGWNPAIDKYYAQLTAGVWPLRPGHHRGVPLRFRQMTAEEARERGLPKVFSDRRADGEVTVRRVHKDGTGALDTGYFAINFHPGGEHGTGSAGCQTMPDEQYEECRDLAYAAISASGQTWVPYVLTEQRLA